MSRSDLVDLVVAIRKETDQAVLVLPLNGLSAHPQWLPKSQIEINREDGRRATITGPRWLFKDKELV